MGNKGNLGAASLLLRDLGWARERVADTIPCNHTTVFKYLTGVRNLTPKSRTRLLREFGDEAWKLIDACDAARNAYTTTGSRIIGEKNTRLTLATRIVAAAALKRENIVGDTIEEDTTTYTIEEWKNLFGEPGSGADIHGRWGGVFATEPCFLDETGFGRIERVIIPPLR